MKKENKKALYESIMATVAKEVKKVLNEDGYEEKGYSEDEIDVQGDTERWCDLIDEYLWDHITGIQSNASETLGLFATLVYLDQLDDEEIKEIAERIMEQIDENEDYDNPPVDEAFHIAVIEKLKEDASDWCADVINEWKLNQ